MKISVVTICLNAQAYIRKALSSVAAQTWHDVEHIIIDGGSTDTTVQIISEMAVKNPQLHWSSAPDNGISDAMNKGLAQVTGDIVCFLHADDFYPDTDVLADVAAVFTAHPDIRWMTGGIQHVDDAGQMLRRFPVRRWSYRRLLRGNIIFHPATFIKREALAVVGGFDTHLRYTMDYDLWLRLGTRWAPFLLDHSLACFRLHSGSMSVGQVDAAFREEFLVRCRYLEGKPLQKILHQSYYLLKFLPNRLSVRF